MPIIKKCVLVSLDRCGSIRALTDGFVAAFGDAVAADHPEKAQIVHFGDTVTLAVPATLRCLTNDNVASQSGRTMGLCPKPHKGTEFP